MSSLTAAALAAAPPRPRARHRPYTRHTRPLQHVVAHAQPRHAATMTQTRSLYASTSRTTAQN